MTVRGLGDASLLQGPLTAFFASRQCPGSAIRAAMSWALHQARNRIPLIGGFHSPLEQSVLRLLLEAGSPAIAVLARPVAEASLPTAWRQALEIGSMAVINEPRQIRPSNERLTARSASSRNDLIARLADQFVVAHASPGGQLERQCAKLQADHREIRWLSDLDPPP